MSRILHLSLVLFACLGLCAVAQAAGAPMPGQQEDLDQIITLDGKLAAATKIEKEDYLSVDGKYKNFPQKVPSCSIKEVIYAERDGDFDQGVTQRELGHYRKAGLFFYRALQNMKDQKWAEEYCNYYLGSVFYANGDYTGYKGKSGVVYSPPSVYFTQVLVKNPKSRFLPEILSKIVRCLAEEGKLTEADAAAKDADERLKKYQDETSRAGGGYAPVIALTRAQLLVAQAHVMECKASKEGTKEAWTNAQDAWQRAVSQVAKYPDLLTEATNGVLFGLLKMGQPDAAKEEANRKIEKFRKDGDLTLLPVLPGTYMVVGLASYTQAIDFDSKGNKIQARKLFAEARWAFTNVMGQFFDNEDYVAQSYYYAGLCYDKLKDIEPDAADKAVRNWRVIIRDFGSSGYKELAEKELQRVGATVAPAATPPAAATPADPQKKG